MKKYLVIGYVENSMMMYESKAKSASQASRFATYMLELPNVYKVEIKKLKEEQDC